MEKPQKLFHKIQMLQQLWNTHNRSNPNKPTIRTLRSNRERKRGDQFQYNQLFRTKCTRKTRIHALPKQRQTTPSKPDTDASDIQYRPDESTHLDTHSRDSETTNPSESDNAPLRPAQKAEKAQAAKASRLEKPAMTTRQEVIDNRDARGPSSAPS